MKKGQVTIFVITGLVILAVIGLVILLMTNSSRKSSNLEQARLEDVQDYMQSCIEEAVKRANGAKGDETTISGLNDLYVKDIKDRIRDTCDVFITENYQNVVPPNVIFIDLEIVEFTDNDPNTDYDEGIPEKLIAKVSYNAKITVDGNSFTLEPILVEYVDPYGL